VTFSSLPLQLPLFSELGESPGSGSALTRAALYDAVYEGRRADLGIYLALAKASHGPVLELGAGTGRLLAPLLAHGIDAVGIECDADALSVGRRRLGVLGGNRFSRRLIEGDMTCFALDQTFSLIVVACNTLSLLVEDAALDATLACVRQHLAPDGAFVFDVSQVEGHSWHRPPYTWRGDVEAVWVAGVAASTTESGSYDPDTRLCNVTREFQLADGRKALAQTESRQRSLDHILRRLQAAGLQPSTPIDESGLPLSPSSTLAFVRSEMGCSVGSTLSA
jgi:SAM-dependent methyltransferase